MQPNLARTQTLNQFLLNSKCFIHPKVFIYSKARVSKIFRTFHKASKKKPTTLNSQLFRQCICTCLLWNPSLIQAQIRISIPPSSREKECLKLNSPLLNLIKLLLDEVRMPLPVLGAPRLWCTHTPSRQTCVRGCTSHTRCLITERLF